MSELCLDYLYLFWFVLALFLMAPGPKGPALELRRWGVLPPTPPGKNLRKGVGGRAWSGPEGRFSQSGPEGGKAWSGPEGLGFLNRSLLLKDLTEIEESSRETRS